MTRTEWYAHWREERIKHPKAPLSITKVSDVLKELYGHQYTDLESAFVHLVERYSDKLPALVAAAKLDSVVAIRAVAKKRAADAFKSLIYADNPLLRMIPKADRAGGYYPVPLKFGETSCQR